MVLSNKGFGRLVITVFIIYGSTHAKIWSWVLSDREGHGHKAVLYKSHFPPLRNQLLERHHCIHRLINHVYYKGQALCYSLPHDMVAAWIKH